MFYFFLLPRLLFDPSESIQLFYHNCCEIFLFPEDLFEPGIKNKGKQKSIFHNESPCTEIARQECTINFELLSLLQKGTFSLQ